MARCHFVITLDVSGEVSLDKVDADKTDGASCDSVQQTATRTLNLAALSRILKRCKKSK